MGLSIFEGAKADDDGIGAVLVGPVSPGRRGREVAPLIRAGCYVTFAGAGLGLLGVLLPHPPSFDVAALVGVQVVMIVWALAFLRFADRLPMWTVQLAPAFGVVQATAGVVFSGDPLGAYAIFYLWPCLYAFYFLSSRDSACIVALVAICYGAVILSMEPTPGAGGDPSVGDLTHQYVLTVGTLAITGIFVTALRSRANRLWTQLSAAARTDMLTGFLNEQGFDEVLGTEIERVRADAGRVGVLLVEIHGITSLSKHYGYAAGDEVLKEIGHLLDDSTRRIDSVGRIGSTTFAISLPGTDEHTGFLLGEQILVRFRRANRERFPNVKASIGVATYPKHASRAEELVAAGAAAAEIGEALGSDRTVVYSPDIEGVVKPDATPTPSEGRANLTTVLSLADVLDFRDPRGAGHAGAVADLAVAIGRDMGLPEQRLQRLRLAGMLHDIGKVGIPDAILDKPGPLSPSEWDQIRRHPEMAARILGARDLADIRGWILARHEQPDGHGYPHGLSGDDIPLESRILAVAESFDAMTSDRPYRDAKTREEAIAELGRYAGVQFDGAVVDAFVRALESATVPHGV